MIEPDRPASRHTRLLRLLVLLATPTPLLAPGCGTSAESTPNLAASAAPAPAPENEFTKKERAKMNEMDREEMLAYKKKLREERGQRPKGE